MGYFYIVALGKRKQYALAADEATRWLEYFNRREERHGGRAGRVDGAAPRTIDAQMKEIAENERPRAENRIVDSASQVVRYASPFKKDALALLKKYKPSAALRAEEIARLTYEDAVNQADEAIASQDWARGDRSAQSRRPQGRPGARSREGQPRPVITLLFATT